MATNTLNILKPSVNNLTVRIFARAAGLDFEEQDVWGKTTAPEFLQKYPAHLTPMLEEEGLPRGALGESCAIMAYLCNKHGLTQFYPDDPGERAMVDNAMFYLIGTFYPLVTRATYPTLGFPQYPGEVGTSDAGDELKAKAQADAEAALAEPLEVYRTFFLGDRPFIGGSGPSIADFRLAATLEFLRAIDYDFPAWAEEYMTRWRRPSARLTRSRRRTCAATSTTSGRRPPEPRSDELRPPARSALRSLTTNERSANARAHAMPVVRHRSGGGRELLHVGLPELEGPGRHSLRRGRAAAGGNRDDGELRAERDEVPALNGGPEFTFSEAISFQVSARTRRRSTSSGASSRRAGRRAPAAG